jgi:hypothetical protein
MLSAAKDALSSRAAQAWANNLIGPYGQVDGLKIDSRRKTVEVTCQLDGEATPITIRIEDYLVEREGEHTFFRAGRFSCSRRWLQQALTDHAGEHRIKLPNWAAGML